MGGTGVSGRRDLNNRILGRGERRESMVGDLLHARGAENPTRNQNRSHPGGKIEAEKGWTGFQRKGRGFKQAGPESLRGSFPEIKDVRKGRMEDALRPAFRKGGLGTLKGIF